MMKTFHLRTHLQLADVFTKALGIPTFLDLISRLGLINIFSANITYPQSLQDTEAISTSEVALVLRGAVKKKTKGVVELKKGIAKMKERCKSGLKKNIAQTKQGNQSLNQKKLKVWLKKIIAAILKS